MSTHWVISAIDNLSVNLVANMATLYPAVSDARGVSQHQVYGTEGIFWYVVLHRFAGQLSLGIADAAVDAQAAAVDAQAAAVIANQNALVHERHSHNLDGTAYGLAINFPPNLFAICTRITWQRTTRALIWYLLRTHTGMKCCSSSTSTRNSGST